MLPIIDLHCDLLCYLAEVEGAQPHDDAAIGCSLPRLEKGNVCLQVMAVFSPHDPDSAWRQVAWFHRLIDHFPDQISRLERAHRPPSLADAGTTWIVAAIESLSSVCSEDEPLADCLHRFEAVEETLRPLVYVSLTHHEENRFGGGNTSRIGLKDDGRAFLDLLHDRKINLDLSHASDPLAWDILEHIDRHSLAIRVLASHSNYRAVCDHPRNLPDDLAREIIARGGIIGLNFLRYVLDDVDPEALQAHLAHAFALGGQQAVCFGADFFAPAQHQDPSRGPFFHSQHSGADRYQHIAESLRACFDEATIENLAYRNAERFLAASLPPSRS